MNISAIGLPQDPSAAGATGIGALLPGFALALDAAMTGPAAGQPGAGMGTTPKGTAMPGMPLLKGTPIDAAAAAVTAPVVPMADAQALQPGAPAAATQGAAQLPIQLPGQGQTETPATTLAQPQAQVQAQSQAPAQPGAQLKPEAAAAPRPSAGNDTLPEPANDLATAEAETPEAPVVAVAAEPAQAEAKPRTLPGQKPVQKPAAAAAQPVAGDPAADADTVAAAAPDGETLATPVARVDTSPRKPAGNADEPARDAAEAPVSEPADAAAALLVAQPVQPPLATPAARSLAAPQAGGTAPATSVAAIAAATAQPAATGAAPRAPAAAKGFAAETDAATGKADADLPAAAAADAPAHGAQPRPAATLASNAPAQPQPQSPLPPQPTPAPQAAPTAEPVVAAQPGHMGKAIGAEIARRIENGEDTLSVRLNPAELGRIDVRIAFDDKGTLRATVHADSDGALQLLRSDGGDLGRALDQAGVRSDSQSLRFEMRSGGDGQTGGQRQHQQSQGYRTAGAEADPSHSEPVYRQLRSDGQVDLIA